MEPDKINITLQFEVLPDNPLCLACVAAKVVSNMTEQLKNMRGYTYEQVASLMKVAARHNDAGLCMAERFKEWEKAKYHDDVQERTQEDADRGGSQPEGPR